MFNKFFVYAGLLSGVLLGTSGDGHSQTVSLQKAAYSEDAQTGNIRPISDVIKKRVTFHVPKTERMIYVDQRDAPAGYVNTRPYAIATVAPEAEQTASVLDAADWRVVTGSRVNLRAGPGTGNAVVGRLTQGTRAIAFSQMDNGWVHLEVPELGITGYMSGKFLSAQN